jgi:Flp pilus assembly protein TadD
MSIDHARPRLALTVAATAALFRLLYWLQARATPYYDYLHLDPLYYVEWGRRIAAGDRLGTDLFEQSPLYAYLLGGLFTLVGERLALLRLLQFAIGALTCAGIGFAARRFLGPREGWAAGLMAAAYGPFLYYEGQVMKSFLNPALAVLVLVSLAVARDGSRRAVVAAGAAVGALALTRETALLLVPVLAAGCIATWPVPARRARLQAAALFLAGAGAVLVPLAVRNLAVSGDLVLLTSGGGEVFYIGNYERANGAYLPPPFVRPAPAFEHEDFRAEARRRTGLALTRAEASRYWFREGVRAIVARPSRWLGLELRKVALFWNARELPDNYSYEVFAADIPLLRWTLTFGAIAPLALVGIALTLPRWRDLLALHLMLGTFLVGELLFFNFSRFRLTAVPVLILFAAAAVTAALEAARRRSFGRAAAIAGCALLLAVPLHADLSSAQDAPGQGDLLRGYALLDAGRPQEAEVAFRRARAAIESWGAAHAGTPVLELGSACYGLGSALAKLSRPGEAIEPLRCAVERASDDAGPQDALAAALLATGHDDEARAALENLVRLKPGRFATYFDLATLAYRRGEGAEAIRRLEEGKEKAGPLAPPDLVDYHLAMGIILFDLGGDRNQALAHLREVLRLEPDHPQAESIRQQIEASQRDGAPPVTPAG